MELSYLRYDLVDGFVHNWLVTGPQRISMADVAYDTETASVGADDGSVDSDLNETPAETSRFVGHTINIGDYEGQWSYLKTEEDHFVELSEVTPTWQLLRAWAYTQVDVPAAQDVTLLLTAYGPADVWVNDEHVARHAGSGDGVSSVSFTASFVEGYNAVLVRFERMAKGAGPFAIALRVASAEPEGQFADLKGAAVVIPTTVLPLKRRRELERTFDAARTSKAVYERYDQISFEFDPVIGRWGRGFSIQLQVPGGQTHSETEVGARPTKETEATLGPAFTFPDSFYHAVLVPTWEEYINEHMWVTRELPLWALDNNRHSDQPYGEFVERRFEALKQAARYPQDVFAEMAKMAVSWWTVVEQPVILRGVDRVKAQAEGSVRELLGLLGILTRFSSEPEFPEALTAPIEDAILGYSYGGAQTHAPASNGSESHDSESHDLLLATCEVMAGQRFADRVFADSGKPGSWLREQGERRAMAWLRQRAAGGFESWDSDVIFAEIIAALVHLVEFAEQDAVFEMATAMLDKTLFSIALNSFKGVFCSTRGVTETGQLFHGMLEATSGISRLMWGMGTFNGHTTGYVSLACAEEYGFPQLIQNIAMDQPEALWSRERHAPGLVGTEEGGGAPAVDKVMYRTPDYALSSVQDYRPGQAGGRENVWHATLDPAARVFVNHPACSTFREARRPNYWRGNASLPRVAQWQDVLFAVYALPEDDWMGFTHAYFPLYAFDAYGLHDGWAFAQKGSGYLALTAAKGVTLLETGMHGGRELRSYGQENVWLCQMGREAQDGTFSEFQASVLDRALTFGARTVQYTTLRGETLSFGWDDPLLRDGEVEPITGFRHLESPYGIAELPAKEFIMMIGEGALRLHLD